MDPGFLEDGWIGAELAVGTDVVLHRGFGMPRCLMIDYAQKELDAERAALKALGVHHGTELGLRARAIGTGTLRVGDVLTLRRAAPAGTVLGRATSSRRSCTRAASRS